MPIRRSMFETNSSSSHSVITGSTTDFEPVAVQPGTEIAIEPGEYGWGYEELHSWGEKASYAYTHAANYGQDWQLEMLRKVIEEYTKVPVRFVVEVSGWDKAGYIDHQSVGVITDADVFDSKENLKAFIFGRGNFVIIDNDNH